MSNLKAVLDKNFNHIGWQLLSYAVVRANNYKERRVTCKILCPCGTTETVTLYVDTYLLDKHYNMLATKILSSVANKKHLEADVAKGLLPSSVLQDSTRYFKELVP